MSEELINQLAVYSAEKLYHEFTDAFVSLIRKPEYIGTQYPYDAFNQFVAPIIDKLSPLRVINIIQWCLDGIDANIGYNLLESNTKIFANDVEANLFWLCLKARCLVNLNKTNEALELLQNANEIFKKQCAVDPTVRAAYHYSNAILHKALLKWETVHEELSLYLSYISLSTLLQHEILNVAEFAAVAALTAQRVVSLNEIASHACMYTLENDATKGWIATLLKICADGRLHPFDQFVASHELQILSHPILSKSIGDIKDKMKLLALVDLAFVQPSKKRTLTYEQISKHCNISNDFIELLVMRAVAREVLIAKIDEINKVVRIFWVKPRMLDKHRLEIVKDRLHEWSEHATKLSDTLESMAPEILAAQTILFQ